ncbi:VOC family protein [Asaia sp. BMEF1]|uniref:VOC family protein n=1 Tax=Asaia sp. BMEF1 TaxID=3155932 RepID=UPI003F67489D
MRHVSRGFWLAMLCGTSLLTVAPLALAQPALAPMPPAPEDYTSESLPVRAIVPPSTPGALTPLTSPATHRLLPGKIVFSMLVTPDLAGAERFYSALFGWGFRPVNDGKTPRVEITLGTQPVGMIVAHKLDDPRHDVPFWMPFLSTSDTATVARVTKQQGGKTLFGPRPIAGLGQAVIVSDPQHGLYAALSAQSGDPVDRDSDPVLNSWSWATLLSPAPRAAAGYYQLLFNYKIVASPEADSPQHYMLTSQDKERASINTLPPGMEPRDRARWIQFIEVRDSAAVSNRAQALGGRVIVPTHVDRDGAQIAVLADPGGAVFGVIESQKDMLEGALPR